MQINKLQQLLFPFKIFFRPNLIRPQVMRSFSVSSITHLIEIQRTETEKQIVIEGVKVKSERKDNLIDIKADKGCPLCRLNIRRFRHTDVLIISQFINSDGTVIPQHITGLCDKQHFNVRRAVALAQKAGLIPKKPGTPMFGDWEKYNSYFKRF